MGNKPSSPTNVQYYYSRRGSVDSGSPTGDSPPRFSGNNRPFDSPSLRRNHQLFVHLPSDTSIDHVHHTIQTKQHINKTTEGNLINDTLANNSKTHVPVEHQLRVTNKQVIGNEEYTFFVPIEIGDFVVSLWSRTNHLDHNKNSHRGDLYSMYIYKNGERLSNVGDAFPLHEKLNNWTEETLALSEVDEIIQLLEVESDLAGTKVAY